MTVLTCACGSTTFEWKRRGYVCISCGKPEPTRESAALPRSTPQPDEVNRLTEALSAIVRLDLDQDAKGRDDFHSGADRFFRAHRIAYDALGFGVAAPTPAQEPLKALIEKLRELPRYQPGIAIPTGEWVRWSQVEAALVGSPEAQQETPQP